MKKSEKADSKPSLDNRSRQLNPNHEQYWKSRGRNDRPETLPNESGSSNNGTDVKPRDSR